MPLLTNYGSVLRSVGRIDQAREILNKYASCWHGMSLQDSVSFTSCHVLHRGIAAAELSKSQQVGLLNNLGLLELEDVGNAAAALVLFERTKQVLETYKDPNLQADGGMSVEEVVEDNIKRAKAMMDNKERDFSE